MEIIAEIGSNWKTLDDCYRSIDIAKDCGADAVKFQTYTHAELFGVPGNRSCQPQLAELHRHAKKVGIEFLCTGFSPEGYAQIDPYVRRHKVASSELTSPDLLNAVNEFRKPVLLSTGGATFTEISHALLVLRNVKVTLLYCVAEYPAKVIDFAWFLKMKKEFSGLDIGYSDHSIDALNIPMLAKDLGSKVIEKHVNFTHYSDTPDAPHSLNKDEFRLMVKNLRGKLKMDETFRPNPWKRKWTALEGLKGYFRPLPDA